MPVELLLGLIIGLPIGLVLGGGMAWIICASHARAQTDIAVALEGQRAAAAEALVEETRVQLANAKAETDTGRETVRKVREAWTAARTRLEQAEKYLKEQKDIVETAKLKIAETFEALAARALAQNNRGFLSLAEERFKAIRADAGADLDARRTAIEALVKPIRENLGALEKQTQELESRRSTAIGSIAEQLRSVAETQNFLHRETAKLVGALKSPQARGRWGEIALRRTAELAGMTPHCDFVEQQTISTDGGRLRPDMVVRLPGGREVVVDSKVPLGGFMEALEAQAEGERDVAMDKHARQVAQHVSRLSAKEYWSQFQSAPHFVVLFIPNDSFLAAAAEKDPDLIASALSKQIVIATPTTFIALLRAIEVGWQQHVAVENAGRIRNLGQDLADRIATLVDHFSKVGTSLGKAVESYNAAVASFESRVLPAARRFKDLGAGGRKEIEELAGTDAVPRRLLPTENGDGEESAEKGGGPRLFE